MSRHEITLTINGKQNQLWVKASDSLLDVLHDELGYADVRYGCGEGVCGTCTVLIDDEPMSGCLVFAVQAEGHQITTVQGLARDGEELHPLQACMLKRGGSQCGFCTPGMILTAHSLVERRGRPSRGEIRYELVGNLCRCTGYAKILDAVEEYADGVAANEADGANR